VVIPGFVGIRGIKKGIRVYRAHGEVADYVTRPTGADCKLICIYTCPRPAPPRPGIP